MIYSTFTMTRHDTPVKTELRTHGLRVTAPRHAVLEWLTDHPHATAEQVHHGVGERLGSLSKQAVYNVLSTFVSADLVRQIKPAGHPARFERRTHDNHHHLVCRVCGHIEDSDCQIGAAPCLYPAQDHGFDIDEAEIVFWGRCAKCRENTDPMTDDN